MGLLSLLQDRKANAQSSRQNSIDGSPAAASNSRQCCDICCGFRPDRSFAVQTIEYPFTKPSIDIFFKTILPNAERRKWIQMEHGKLDADFSEEPAPPCPTVRAWKLSSRKGCQSCKLIDQVTENVYFQVQIKNKWGYSLPEEIAGLYCIALSITDGPLQLIFVDESRTRGRDRFTLLELHGLPGNPKIHPLIGNRPLICARNDDENAVRKIKRWLSTCNTHHKCVPSDTWRSYMPRRVLRVDMSVEKNFEIPTVTLVEDAEPERYVALSYCWGKNETTWLRTTSSTLRVHLKSVQSESRRLPSAINDMALLVAKLGIRYLWVDALCIIQDSPNDWEAEAAKMGDVYARAYFVICADVTGDCSKPAAVPQMGGNLLNTIIVGDTDKLPKCLRFPGWRHHEQFAPVLPAYLDGRCWCFQERILSRRYLRLTDYEMSWECLGTGLICECSEPCDKDDNLRERSADVRVEERTADVRFFPSSSSSTMNYSTIRSALIKPETSYANRYLAWHAMIEEYSRRGLTEDSDKLVAISGIAKKMGQSLMSQNGSTGRQFYAGLWHNNLIQDLTWQVTGFHPRMAKSLLLQPGEVPLPATLLQPKPGRRNHQVYVAPSWSWASSTYPVRYWNQPGDLYEKLERFEPEAKFVASVMENSRADEYGAVLHAQIELKGRVDQVEFRAAHLPSEQTITSWGLELGRDVFHDYADSSLYPLGNFLFYARDPQGNITGFMPDNASVAHPPDAERVHPCRELFTTLACPTQGCECRSGWKGPFWTLFLGRATYIGKENSVLQSGQVEVHNYLILKKIKDTNPPIYERVGVIKRGLLAGNERNMETTSDDSHVRIV